MDPLSLSDCSNFVVPLPNGYVSSPIAPRDGKVGRRLSPSRPGARTRANHRRFSGGVPGHRQ
eukprot:COSAG05_NODE_18128_length_313_cov_0.953271_2_plen_61_part_01